MPRPATAGFPALSAVSETKTAARIHSRSQWTVCTVLRDVIDIMVSYLLPEHNRLCTVAPAAVQGNEEAIKQNRNSSAPPSLPAQKSIYQIDVAAGMEGSTRAQ
jgi:hypothetical protein